MTVQTLYTAATGMEALETKLDVIANNMANVNTTGFKKDRANFEDVFYRQYRLPGVEDADGNRTSTGIEVGLGTRVSSTQSNYEQGAFETTGNQLDFAIEGDGFFQVRNPNGDPYYTRAGNFGLNANGQLTLGSANNGYLIEPPITIPPDATDVVVSADGQVQVRTQSSSNLQTIGQLQLAKFLNPDGLIKLGDNLYQKTDASGNETLGNPGIDGLGNLRQGFLEASNVEPVTELIDLITTQRAFELGHGRSQVVPLLEQARQHHARIHEARVGGERLAQHRFGAVQRIAQEKQPAEVVAGGRVGRIDGEGRLVRRDGLVGFAERFEPDPEIEMGPRVAGCSLDGSPVVLAGLGDVARLLGGIARGDDLIFDAAGHDQGGYPASHF